MPPVRRLHSERWIINVSWQTAHTHTHTREGMNLSSVSRVATEGMTEL
jgi:hypothetical protein